MGNCLNVSPPAQTTIQQPYPINPYGIDLISQQPQQYPQIYPYFDDNLNISQAKRQKNIKLNQKVAQNDKVIAMLTQKIILQNIKLQEQDNVLKNIGNKKYITNTNTNKDRDKDKDREIVENKYQGCYSYGKNNILKWQGICQHCKIKRCQRFLDYSNIKNMCKCQGFGIIQGSKINKKCSQWFCGEKIKPFLICQKCYGYGFKFYEKSFFSF